MIEQKRKEKEKKEKRKRRKRRQEAIGVSPVRPKPRQHDAIDIGWMLTPTKPTTAPTNSDKRHRKLLTIQPVNNLPSFVEELYSKRSPHGRKKQGMEFFFTSQPLTPKEKFTNVYSWN